MDFKLGASLWSKIGESKPFEPRQYPAEDFGKKLGLPSSPQEPTRQPEDHASSKAYNDDKQWQGAYLQLVQRKAVNSDEHAELYAWSSLAGHHLSYQPEAFESAAVLQAAEHAVTASLPRQHPLVATIRSSASADEQIAPDALARPPSIDKASPPPLRLPTSRQDALATFFAQRWPERRLAILPHESGVEIIVRDFLLSEEEQLRLTDDLRQFMNSSQERLEQIWVNGRCVWQRPAIQSNTTQE